MRLTKIFWATVFLGTLALTAINGIAAVPAESTTPQPTTTLKHSPEKPKIVLVIDDIGYNKALGKRAAELPGAITYAVIPHTPMAKKLAFYALNQNPDKEIIVHMPMQSTLDKSLGKGALTEDLEKAQFLARLRHALSEVPFARGLSNHMGSHLTRLPDRMQWLMSELQRHQYFYLDSRTSSSNSPKSAAEIRGVPYLKRDIFLDHDPSPAAIASAFNGAIKLARQQGYAVVLAHPYPSTLDYLEVAIPNLANENISLATASEFLKTGIRPQLMAASEH